MRTHRTHRRPTLILAAALAGAAAIVAPVRADVLLSQPGGDGAIQASRPSNINPGATPFSAAIVAENFSLTTGATLESLTFWGLNSADFSNPTAFINSFRIRIFEDSGADQPGALVSDQTISKNSIATAPAGTAVYYSYALTLPVPVGVNANTTYWLSIAANKQFNDNFDYWSWQRSPTLDGTQMQLQFSPAGAWSLLSGSEQSVCFQLEGTPAPACAADLDGSGTTDVLDFAIFAAAFGSTLGDANFDPAADLDGSNTIDVLDFSLFAADFGCPN